MMDESGLQCTVITIYLSIEHKLTVFATVWGRARLPHHVLITETNIH